MACYVTKLTARTWVALVEQHQPSSGYTYIIIVQTDKFIGYGHKLIPRPSHVFILRV